MNSENEVRLVHREETFNDLAVRELARGRSACICRLQFGACTKEECKGCEHAHNYSACYKQLNEYDRSRLSTYVHSFYMQDSLTPGKWMSYKNLKRHLAKWIAVVAACLALIIIPLLIMPLGNEPVQATSVSDEVNKRIVITKKLVDINIKDINKDGLVNCIDHAIIFKLIWDSVYPERKDDCIIIRNKSLTMHHLFNGVYDGDSIVFVEPWASDPYKYLMSSNWSSWNPKYNKYDETEKWLGEVK